METRELMAFSEVPQPTASPRAPFRYCTHKNLGLHPILDKVNPLHTLTLYLNDPFQMHSPLCGYTSQAFRSKICVTCPYKYIRLVLIALIAFDWLHTSRSSLLPNLCLLPITSCPFEAKYFPEYQVT
jgi:hypothetical protein